MKLILSAFLIPLMLLSACAATKKTADMPEDFSVTETALYLSRASLHSTDFEQYKLNGFKLFQECGSIRKGRHIPAHQQLFDLDENKHHKLMQSVWSVLKLAHDGKAQLADPGENNTMFDPGRLFLTIKGNGNTLKLHTSLDTVSDANSDAEEALNTLARDIRGLTKPAACGNPSFYGLGHSR